MMRNTERTQCALKTCTTYDDDFIPYMVANKPVFVTGVTDGWLLAEQEGLDRLLHDLGGFETGVSIPQGSSDRMLFSNFLGRSAAGERGLYAKDIHIDQFLASRSSTSSSSLTNRRPEYSVPALFRDDWLNWYWQTCRTKDCDDYSFLYVGGPGSFTAMHHDVVCSYSWSVNLRGRKKWTLFPPTSVPALLDSSGELVDDARKGHFDASRYPDLASCERIEALQELGVCIFIPCGWYHCVENLDPEIDERQSELTVSINRNWLNGFNVMQVWLFLKSELASVHKELLHLLDPKTDTLPSQPPSLTTRHAATPTCVLSRTAETTFMERKEWILHCDRLLRANSALGLGDFVELLAARACMMLSCCFPSLDANLLSIIKTLSPQYHEPEHVAEQDKQLCTMLQQTSCPCLLQPRPSANFIFQDDGAEVAQQSASVWAFHCSELARVLQDISVFGIAIDIINALHQDEEAFEASEALSLVAKRLASP